MKSKELTPLFGAAYYPENWPDEIVENDINLMHTAKMNVVRLGEFAWSRMEPQEGRFDFEWLHGVIGKLYREGISVILGTPTATPPIWFTQKYSDALKIDEDGRTAQHGARRHCCSNNPHYREHSARIVKRLAQEFKNDPAVIGWQIDNEITPEGSGCFCPECRKRFIGHLKEKFGTVEELNRRWDLGLWSMEYGSFEQIPAPERRTWHHPSLKAEWMLFQSLSNAGFVSMQADILHGEGVLTPVGTDMMPNLAQDYITTCGNLDIIQFNHYDDEKSLWSSAFWDDYLRNLKSRPFWNTETSACWPGGTVPGGFKPYGFCTVNTWITYALGGEACLYWLWRSHWAGQEMMHGSVLSSDGRPMHTFEEIQAIGEDLEKAGEILNGTSVKSSSLAIHLSHRADVTFRAQPISEDMKDGAYCRMVAEKVYRPLMECHLRADMIDPSHPLDGYRIIITPFLPDIGEADLARRIRCWVEQGGIWVVGPLTDIRNGDGAKFTNAPYGMLEEFAGVTCRYQIPASPQTFNAAFRNGAGYTCETVCDGLECHEGTEAFACYTDGPLKDLAAITFRRIGRGGVCVLGTMPSGDGFARMILQIGDSEGIHPVVRADANLLVVPREGKAGKAVFVLEYWNKPAALWLERPMKDLLSGKSFKGNVTVQPYGVLCLVENGRGEKE